MGMQKSAKNCPVRLKAEEQSTFPKKVANCGHHKLDKCLAMT